MLIKEKVKLSAKNKEFKISFNSSDGFLGLEQEINKLTRFNSLHLVNPIRDEERRKFKLEIPSQRIEFFFRSGTIFNANYTSAGFTANEIQDSSLNFLNSFFIIDCYDTFDINTQTKLFTTYLTKKGNINSTIQQITNKSHQLYYWYFPTSFIDNYTGNTATLYTKFSFFNAKTGKLTLFHNQDRMSDLSSHRLFFDTQINIENRTWRFVPTTTVKAREIVDNQYVEKMNKTYDSFEGVEQVFPEGNTFTVTGGTADYSTT